MPPEPLTRVVSVQQPNLGRNGQAPSGLPVKYLGGFAGHQPRSVTLDAWRLTAEAEGISVWWGSQKRRVDYVWTCVRFEPWDQLRKLSFTAASATRANVPAVALFGLLGMAASREPGSLIAIAYDEGDVFFSASLPSFQLASMFNRFVEGSRVAADKIYVDGAAIVQPAEPTGLGANHEAGLVGAGIRELASLLADGMITQDEYDAKRADLLSRL